MNRTARLLAVLLAVVLVGVGVYVAYNTGFDNGAVAASTMGGADGTDNAQLAARSWGRPYGWHGGFGFFPFFLFFPILFFILIFGVIRPWRWGGGGYGRGWSGPGRWGPPRDPIEERLADWHKQAHGEEGEKQS